MAHLTDIPAGLQTGFLKETESSVMPEIRREGNKVYFPAFIRKITRSFPRGEAYDFYRYFEIPVAYVGQNLQDYDAFAIASYAGIRKYFYGPPEVQLEQQLKGTFASHQYAVRAAFPKTSGEVIPAVERFQDIRTRFWETVDAACTDIGKTRADLPERFNSEMMLTFASSNGMTLKNIAEYAQKFMIVSLNLLQNGRNWDELFPAPETGRR